MHRLFCRLLLKPGNCRFSFFPILSLNFVFIETGKFSLCLSVASYFYRLSAVSLLCIDAIDHEDSDLLSHGPSLTSVVLAVRRMVWKSKDENLCQQMQKDDTKKDTHNDIVATTAYRSVTMRTTKSHFLFFFCYLQVSLGFVPTTKQTTSAKISSLGAAPRRLEENVDGSLYVNEKVSF